MSRLRRPLLPAPILAALLVLAAAPPVQPPASPAPPRPEIAATATAIQNTCFAAYPPSLVRRMSGLEGPPPAAVSLDPVQQVRYLRTEDRVRKGLFYPSLLDELLPAFERTVTPGVRFLDLGSGDGRVVFLAAALGARATGIEYEASLDRIARRARARLRDHVPRRHAVLKRGDFFAEDLAPYDVIFYFGAGSDAEDRMADKLRREARPGAILLVAHPTAARFAAFTIERTLGPVAILRKTSGAPPEGGP